MAVQTLIIAPEYNSFYAAGRDRVRPPIDLDYGGLAATKDCITVPTLYYNDGDTTVTFGPVEELSNESSPTYDGVLNTPERKILLSEANMDLATIEVPTTRTRIRIWLNHPTSPTAVSIGWG